MFERKLLKELKQWKASANRKPILLDGARQTGKSFLLREIFAKEFRQAITLDFATTPEVKTLFEGNRTPEYIIEQIELELDVEFDPTTDLLILDEIGECQNAVTSLKFFAEQAPEMFICASGSNIGLLDSFPVGKVHILEIHPMSFEEFLMANNSQALLRAWHRQDLGLTAHRKLFSQLLDYYFVGGMPEAVDAWFNSPGNPSLRERILAVSTVHSNLVAGYCNDFGKYSGKTNATHIEEVFRNIPRQLSVTQDASVTRYKFVGVIEKRNRYSQLRGPIDWLVKTHLASRCYTIEGAAASPLMAYSKENRFKLFLIDVGLLGHMLDIKYDEHQNQEYNYKGYIAENFVQNEFVSEGYKPTYSWQSARAEIEFLYKTFDGAITPIEVKSGRRTQAKSLKTYITKYKPQKVIKLIGSTGSTENPDLTVLPLYYASQIARD
jgi:uncharacterized protein